MAGSIANAVKVTGSATTSVTTAAITSTTGNTFVVDVSHAASTAPNTPTDSKGNTYTIRGTTQTNAGLGAATRFVCENGAGGSGHTLTQTFAAAADPAVFFVEVAGVLAASFDTASRAQAPDNATPFTVTSGTLAQANEIVLAFLGGGDSGSNPATVVESTGFTIAISELNASLFWPGAVAYKVVSAITALTPSFTETGVLSGTSLHIAGFKEAAGPTIISQPTNQIVNASATATFSVVSPDATSYQWQDNSAGVFADISGATSSSYVTAAAGQAFQGRKYRAVVTNANGSTTSLSASLGVLGFAVYLWDTSVQSGGDVWLRDPGQFSAGGSASIVGAGQIPGGEAFGAAALTLQVEPVGINSAEAIGQPAVGGSAALVDAAGVPSAESFGPPAIALQVNAAALSSAEAWGAPSIAAQVAAAAAASAELFGAIGMVAGIAANGIASAEGIGQPAVGAAAATVDAASITSAEACGAPVLGAQIESAAITSAEAIGQPAVGAAAAGIDVAAIASAEAFGVASLAAIVSSGPIVSAESFGSLVLAASILHAGIGSAEAFGQPAVIPSASITAAGVATGEAFGAPAIAASVAGGFVDTAEAFGLPAVQLAGPVQIICIGIASAEAVGTPRIGDLAVDIAQGAGRRRFFDSHAPLTLALRGIQSAEAVGRPIVATRSAAVLRMASAPSAEAFGVAHLVANLSPYGIPPRDPVFGALRVCYQPTPQQRLEDDLLVLGAF